MSMRNRSPRQTRTHEGQHQRLTDARHGEPCDSTCGAQHVGQDSTSRAGSSRQEVDVDGAGGASGPATPPSVGKLTNCRSRRPRLPSPLQVFTHSVPPNVPDEDTETQRVTWGRVEVGTSHQAGARQSAPPFPGGREGFTSGSGSAMLHTRQEGIQLSACPHPPG